MRQVRIVSNALASILTGAVFLHAIETGRVGVIVLASIACIFILGAMFFSHKSWYYAGRADAFREIAEQLSKVQGEK